MKTKSRKTIGTDRRLVAFAPFHLEGTSPLLGELEQILLFALQELMELFGGKRYVDLGASSEWGDSGLEGREELVSLYRDLARQSGAGFLLTGRGVRADEATGKITFQVELVRVNGNESVFCRDYELELWNLIEENSSLVGDSRTGAAFQAMVREIFDTIRTTARWRYSGDADDRAYFEYRLEHGLSPSFEALRCFVRARRFCNGPEKKLDQYKRSLLHDPCLGAALRNIAFLHKEQKKYNLALRYYRDAVAVLIDRATLSEAYSEMGLCYANAGRLESALECWHKASHWDPSNTDVYANLAIAYEEKGSLEDAIRYFNEAQKLDPEYYWACRGLGRIYCNQGQWREAIEQLHKQVRIAPKDAWGHYALGSCYAREGKLDEAREYLRRALELDPDGDAGRKAFQGLMQIDA